MKFAVAALIGSASALTVDVNDQIVGDVANVWMDNLNSFQQWQDQNNQATMEEAGPYIQEIQNQLEQVMPILEDSQRREERQAEDTAEAIFEQSKQALGCCEGDACPTETTIEEEYCWEDCCQDVFNEEYGYNEWVCEDQYCRETCQTEAWTANLWCNRPDWFAERLDRTRVNSFVECGCTNNPFTVSE